MSSAPNHTSNHTPAYTPIRLVVCDIDGTMVRHDKSLPNANILAVRQLTAAETRVSLISARPMSGMLWIADELELDGPFGAFNGGTLFDRNGVIGEPQRLAPDVARTILTMLDEAGIDAWLFTHERWHARNADNPHVLREKLSSGLEPILSADLRALCIDVDKIVGVSDDHALLKQMEAAMQQATHGKATVALSQPYFLDATALLANKGDGVAAVAAAMKVPLAEVAVIGDMPNDLPMFARAGLSIAMGQAPDAVRAAADWTTSSNEEDGVAHAIERLIEEQRCLP
jgi:Cof subfamily protein (haloacid dehalogenase superfamily)